MNNSKKIIFFILAIFLILPPFFNGEINFFIRRLILMLVGLALLLYAGDYRKKEFFSDKNFFYSPLFLLCLYMIFSLVSVFFSVSPYHSEISWLESLGYAALFFTIIKINWEKPEIYILIKIFLAVSAILSIIGIYFYLVGSYGRLTSLFWWPNPFAGYLLFALFLGLGWFFKSAGKEKILSLLFLIIIILAFILTGSRGAFLSFILILPVYGYFKLRSIYTNADGAELKTPLHPPYTRGTLDKPPLHKGGVGGFINLVIKIFAIFFVSLILAIGVNKFKNDNFGFSEHIKTSGTQSDFSSAVRLNYWQGAWEMFKARPLTGWGIGEFGTVYHLYQKDPISSGKYAHNLYLEILAEQGIFVFVAFVLFLGYIFFAAFKKIKEKEFAFPLFAGTLAFLIHNGVDIDWHFKANTIVFWIFLGLLYNVSREKTPQPPFIRGGSENNPFKKWDKGGFIKKILIIFSVILISFGIILFYDNYYYGRGIKFKEENKLAEAEKAFEKSLFLNPDPNYLREFGIIKYSRAIAIGGADGEKILNEAKEISDKIIKSDSYNALNYELSGRIHFAQGNIIEAEKNFKEAVKLNQFNLKHYINLASLLINRGRNTEAKELINKVFSYYPIEIVNNKKVRIMENQEITSGIEKDIEHLNFLLREAY